MNTTLTLLSLAAASCFLVACTGVKPDAQYSTICHTQKSAIIQSKLNPQPGHTNPATRASMIQAHKDFHCHEA